MLFFFLKLIRCYGEAGCGGLARNSRAVFFFCSGVCWCPPLIALVVGSGARQTAPRTRRRLGHPLRRRGAWAAEIQDALGGGDDYDGGVWVDPNATHVGMISPHGRFRVGWDLATALLLVYVAVIEPLRLGWPSYFASESGEGQWRNQASTVPFRPLSRE